MNDIIEMIKNRHGMIEDMPIEKQLEILTNYQNDLEDMVLESLRRKESEGI